MFECLINLLLLLIFIVSYTNKLKVELNDDIVYNFSQNCVFLYYYLILVFLRLTYWFSLGLKFNYWIYCKYI